MNDKDSAVAREALRQQMLIRALWRDARPAVVEGWMRDEAACFQRGLSAYQAHGGAVAERALAAAYPTIRQLLGEQSFATMARVFWLQHPPERGDLAQWGETLAAFLERSETLAEEPYLGDVARLDWAVHRAEMAADAPAQLEGAWRLETELDPDALTLRLAPGLYLLSSPHPIAAIWLAHHRAEGSDDQRFAAVREAFAAGRGEQVRVWRQGFRAAVEAVASDEFLFMQALLDRQTLAQALDAAGADWGFEAWLIRALQERWVTAVDPTSGD